MKQRITEIAKANKISEVGFCKMEDYFKKAKNEDFKGVFTKDTPLSFDAKTAIVFAFGYFVDRGPGNVSRYAWGKDYHIVTKEKMMPIVECLKKEGYLAEAFADTGVLNERLLAKLSGIAFIGRNKMAINERLGSYFFIGYILTDCLIEPDCENESSCINCGKCISMCPLGAISDEGLDQERCLSYISQKKGELSPEEIDAMVNSGKIWGCDICQEVCPHNMNIQQTDIEEFNTNLISNLQIEDMSNRDFKEKFGDRAFAWRGKSVIIRNCEYVYIIGREKN